VAKRQIITHVGAYDFSLKHFSIHSISAEMYLKRKQAFMQNSRHSKLSEMNPKLQSHNLPLNRDASSKYRSYSSMVRL